VPLINFMSKNPEQFKAATFDGQGSCLDMMFALIGKIFEVARIKEDEIESMCAVTLIISLLENVTGIESSIYNIIEFFVKELGCALTPEYKCMLSQGICMSLWYSAEATVQALEQMQATEKALEFMFSLLESLKQDFELKRFAVGFTSLIVKDPSTLAPSIQTNYPQLMKALVFLTQKSIYLREKKATKEEEADEDVVEQAIYEDEDVDEICSNEDDDEDYDCNEDLEDRDLYDSKLDAVDEVLYFRDALLQLQQNNTQMYDFLINCLDNNEQNALTQCIKRAEDLEQQEQQQMME
jgi:hypothetical protein